MYDKVASIIDWIALVSVRSASKLAAEFGKSEFISLVTFSADCLFKSTIMTFDPWEAKILAIPSPMPWPAPVTKRYFIF